jgi:hypothetical protein
VSAFCKNVAIELQTAGVESTSRSIPAALSDSAEAVLNKERLREATCSGEEAGCLFPLMLEVLPPYLVPHAGSSLSKDGLSSTLIPVFVERRPSPELET